MKRSSGASLSGFNCFCARLGGPVKGLRVALASLNNNGQDNSIFLAQSKVRDATKVSRKNYIQTFQSFESNRCQVHPHRSLNSKSSFCGKPLFVVRGRGASLQPVSSRPPSDLDSESVRYESISRNSDSKREFFALFEWISIIKSDLWMSK